MSQDPNQYRHVDHYNHWEISGYPLIPADVQMLHPDDTDTHEVSPELLQEIANAILAEHHAVLGYAQLAELAPTPAVKQLILDIRKDEKRHYHRFTAIYAAWTGGKMVELTQPSLPASFAEGVKKAIKVEVDYADRYKNISQKINIPYVQRSFLDASYDERRHAKLFMYIDSLKH